MELSLVGMFHKLTPGTVRKLSTACNDHPIKCRLEREPENPHDANAVKVVAIEKPWAKAHGGMPLGYVARQSASVIAPVMDAGEWDFTSVRLMSVDGMHGSGELMAQRPKAKKA